MKKKKEKGLYSKINKLLGEKLKSKKVLKEGKMTITIPERNIKAGSALFSENPIYMKKVIEQEKRSMFFS